MITFYDMQGHAMFSKGRGGGSIAGVERRVPVEENLCFFKSYHALGYQRVQFREEGVNLVPGVDDLHNDRQVLGKAKNAACMNAAVGAETQYAPQCRCPGKTVAAGSFHDFFVEQSAVMPVVFADENPEQHAFGRKVHFVLPHGLQGCYAAQCDSCHERKKTESVLQEKIACRGKILGGSQELPGFQDVR